MTVYELIKKLEDYPLDMRVLTLGYEGGCDDIDVKTEDIVFDVNGNDTWYTGQHEYARFMDNLPNSQSQWKSNGLKSGQCVIITRTK
jgi:hypothetical protein